MGGRHLHDATRIGLFSEHQVDHGVDIGDVHLAVAGDVGGIGRRSFAQHDIDDGVNIGDVHLTIARDIAGGSPTTKTNNMAQTATTARVTPSDALCFMPLDKITNTLLGCKVTKKMY